MMTNDIITSLLVDGHGDRPALKQEVSDAQWADFGRIVANNIFNTDDFTYALTHAALKAKDTKQLLGFVRAFILTGAKP